MKTIWILYLITINSESDLPITSEPLKSFATEKNCMASRRYAEDYASTVYRLGPNAVSNKFQRWGNARREYDCLPILAIDAKFGGIGG